jgi:endonuclease/exonuclease/phosphatase family metal-dependent hydrolase
MRAIVRKLLVTVNILLAGGLLLSYLSVHISPVSFVLPAYFGLLYPYLLILNIVIAIIWAVNLKPFVLISVVAIAAGFNHHRDYIRLFRPESTGSYDFTLKSYNVRLFNHYEGPETKTTENDIVAFIAETGPDILCMQEYYVRGSGEELRRQFSKVMGESTESHIKLLGKGRDRFYGIATFSKYPVINRGEIIHPNSASLTIYTDVVIGIDTVRIFNNHLQTFRLKTIERSFFEEITDRNTLQASGIMGYPAALREGFVRRADQAEVLKAFIDHSPYKVIVTGDFNDMPVSYSYRKIKKGLTDSFVASGYGAGYTYKGPYPPNRIDYILHDRGMSSAFFSILKVKYSDHYPVMAGFSFGE